MAEAPRISRRAFLLASAAVGGGLAIGVGSRGLAAVPAKTGSPEITAWIVIRPDDTVLLRISRSEMGQGSLTGLAQLMAEELECDWRKIDWEFTTPGANLARKGIWGDLETGGSASILDFQEPLRKAGAAARLMLVQAAADGWDVPAAECIVEKGVISHKLWSRRTTYGKVAAAAARLEVPKDVALKDPKDWKLIGEPVKRLDTPNKVTGKLVYSIDVKLPGMLNATIRESPVFGGKVKSVDDGKARRMAGVKKILRVGDSAVAAIADTWWHAKTALDAVEIEWDVGEHGNVSSASIDALLTDGLAAEKTFVFAKLGDSKAAIAAAAKRIEAIYDYPFQTHACMEPMNATALCTPDRCEVWCPTQGPDVALSAAAEAAGLRVDKCDIHRPPLGGGFGRGLLAGDVTRAVLVAKQMPGTPVKLLWSREEDLTRGRYHPIMKARLTGGIDADGNLAGLELRLSGQSIIAAIAPKLLKDGNDPDVFRGLNPEGKFFALEYGIANLTLDHAMRNTPVPPAPWRGVYINPNAIFLECFMDELVHAAGKDALEFRRKLLADQPQALAVLDAVAARGGWHRNDGRYRGLARFRTNRSHVAALAEITVTDETRVKVHRIVVAIDPGVAVNPAQIERQISGSVVYGLSALFLQECTVRDGRIEQENFDSYDSMRLRQMPKVEAMVMPSGGFWGGVGEPPMAVVAPAVLNAYFSATGRRIRSFPLKNHGIKLV